jgi:hypothetical protein
MAFRNSNTFPEKDRICQLHQKNDFQFAHFEYAEPVDSP